VQGEFMATYVLIPGAGGDARYWRRLEPLLRERGHATLAVELAGPDNSAGLAEYTDSVVKAIGKRTNVILVGQSLGGFTAPLVCERVPVDLLILLNAMVPRPGETAGQWWDATGQPAARAAYAAADGRDPNAGIDVWVEFFHDVPPEVTAEAKAQGERPEAPIVFSQPWPLEHWPDVPTRFLQGRDDRLFPLEFQRRVVRERLGIELDEIPGGHLVALSQPDLLATQLEAYRIQHEAALFPA
jgi:pimeloyl-ACP methyl ester carboxylesterase